MKNKKQIQVILRGLTFKKNNLMKIIFSRNQDLQNKKEYLLKIKEYLQDYQQQKNLCQTVNIPSLLKNLEDFSKKIQQVIQITENEITQLELSVNNLQNDLMKINQKMDIMDIFMERIQFDKLRNIHAIEQNMLDDFSSRNLRDAHG